MATNKILWSVATSYSLTVRRNNILRKGINACFTFGGNKMGAIDIMKKQYCERLQSIMYNACREKGYAYVVMSDKKEDFLSSITYDLALAISEYQAKGPYLMLIKEMCEWLQTHAHLPLAPELLLWQMKAEQFIKE